MAIELGGIQLRKISRISSLEQAGFVRYRIPGLEGELAQNLGRPSVRLRIEGIHYGADAQEGLEKLRTVYLEKEPVEFLAEIVGKAYFSKVVLEHLDVVQDAKFPDQFSFQLEIAEYVEPPQPILQDPTDVNSNILDDAKGFMNAALLPDKLDLPSIKDPTWPMGNMLFGLKGLLAPLDAEEPNLNDIYGDF